MSPELRKRLADLTDSESARRQMKNLFYIHANLAEEKDPRIVLKFPRDESFMLVFHGNLVHCGAKSEFPPNPFAMYYSKALRAFAYVSKLGE